MKNLILERGTGLIVIAHPDDETIWMGGVILMNPQIKWTIFSLCRKDDVDRAPKFRKVCKFYGARGIISDLEDEGILNIKKSLPEIEERIKKVVRSIRQAQDRQVHHKTFDYIFTHGVKGEYGHSRHKSLHKVVKKLVSVSELRARQVFYFDYFLNEKNNVAMPAKNGNFCLKLSLRAFKTKRDVIEKMYGFSKESFEYRSCNSVETFQISNLKSQNHILKIKNFEF